MTTSSNKPRIKREAKLQYVPLNMMRVSPTAQRDLQQSRVDKLAAEFDIEQMGTPTVNFRDGGWAYIIDGQHRYEALKIWLGDGWESQQIQCWAYEGLSEKEEADKFLKLSDTLGINAFAKFKIGVTAGRAEECEINAVVRHCGLKVSNNKDDTSVSAVAALRRVWHMGGAGILARTLVIIRDGYGRPGLKSAVIEGIGLTLQRYGDELKDERMRRGLEDAMGGINGLTNRAEILRRTTGASLAHCMAASAIELYNKKRGKNLPGWWRESNGSGPSGGPVKGSRSSAQDEPVSTG